MLQIITANGANLKKTSKETNLNPTTNDKQNKGKFKGVNFSFNDLVKKVLAEKKRKEEKPKENTGETMHHLNLKETPSGLALRTLEKINTQASTVAQGKKAFSPIDIVTKNVSQEKQVTTSISEKVNPLAIKAKETGDKSFSSVGNLLKNLSKENKSEASVNEKVNTLEIKGKEVREKRFSFVDTPHKKVNPLATKTKETGENKASLVDAITKNASQEKQVTTSINEKGNPLVTNVKETGEKRSPLVDNVIKNTSQEKQVTTGVNEKADILAAKGKETGENKFLQVNTVTKKAPKENKEVLTSKERETILPGSFKVNVASERVPENTVSLPRATFQNVMQDIVQKIKLLVNEKQSSLEVQLKPEYLGKVKILLLSHEGLLTAKVIAENSQTANLLNNNLQQIRQSLEEQGVKVEYFGVDVGSGQEGHGEENNNQNQKGPSYHTSRQNKYFESDTVSQKEEDNSGLDGRLNILA